MVLGATNTRKLVLLKSAFSNKGDSGNFRFLLTVSHGATSRVLKKYSQINVDGTAYFGVKLFPEEVIVGGSKESILRVRAHAIPDFKAFESLSPLLFASLSLSLSLFARFWRGFCGVQGKKRHRELLFCGVFYRDCATNAKITYSWKLYEIRSTSFESTNLFLFLKDASLGRSDWPLTNISTPSDAPSFALTGDNLREGYYYILKCTATHPTLGSSYGTSIIYVERSPKIRFFRNTTIPSTITLGNNTLTAVSATDYGRDMMLGIGSNMGILGGYRFTYSKLDSILKLQNKETIFWSSSNAPIFFFTFAKGIKYTFVTPPLSRSPAEGTPERKGTAFRRFFRAKNT